MMNRVCCGHLQNLMSPLSYRGTTVLPLSLFFSLKTAPKPHSFSLSRSPPISSSPPSPPISMWAPPMLLAHPRPTTRVSFCTRSNEGGSNANKEILVQHLLLDENNLKLLLELQQKIAAGEDLSDLAVEYSKCPSKTDGGMLGWVRKGQMVPEFEEAAFNAPLNKVVRCKTKFGWHLLQVLNEREESVLQDIQPEELHSKMLDPSFFEEVQLIDVREPDEVARASLPGFKVLPLCQFGSWGAEITNEFDPLKETYVLCHHGMRSLQVAKWLQMQGFKRVFNVAGGIHAYAIKADASIPTY